MSLITESSSVFAFSNCAVMSSDIATTKTTLTKVDKKAAQVEGS